jgi:pimeloyl-ACP methyl ester carboxylesterase
VRKELPTYTLDFVFHPEHDTSYKHFENGARHPFQPDPDNGVPRVNAWWLAESALLTYWGDKDAIEKFAAAGLTAKFLRAGATDCYVAWRDGLVIVAFRGTQPDDKRDLLTDLNIRFMPRRAGRVHCGFMEALDDIWPALEAELTTLAGRKVWFCGHSLGGALATLAADRFAETRGVCTFGCPLVGDAAFADDFNDRLRDKCFRYVNHHDIVTRVPPSVISYTHVASARFIARDGSISEAAPSLLEFVGQALKAPRAVVDSVSGLWRRTVTSGPPFLLDHMPKAYAIGTWNDYAANG